MNHGTPWHDDQYLFRLTSTFGWDDAISLCETLVLGIENAASRVEARRRRRRLRERSNNNKSEADDDVTEEDDPDEQHQQQLDGYDYYFNDSLRGSDCNHQYNKSFQQWIRHAHAQLFYIDQWGNSPIHAASYVKPPVNVIEALFRVGRALRKHSSSHHYRGAQHTLVPVWATPCKDGSTPFLVACSTGASNAVLHRYLDEVEYYIERGWVDHPESARRIVLRPDDQGVSPLMGWMNFHHEWIRRRLLERRPPGGQRSNSNNGRNSHQSIPRGELAMSEHLPGYWNLVCRMLCFATRNIRPHEPVLAPVLLHRCAAIAMHCPVSLLEWVASPGGGAVDDETSWIPPHIGAATADTLGKLPLHRAMEALDHSSIFDENIVHHGADFDTDVEGDASDVAKKPPPSAETDLPAATVVAALEAVVPREEARIYNHPKLEHNRTNIIRKILQWHPGAVKTPFPNGRTPMVQAIAYGGTWHSMGYYQTTIRCGWEKNDKTNNVGLVQLLWDCAPEQTSEIDPVSGLYPFMLAATVQQNHGGGVVDDREDCDRLDTIFCLLRNDPQLVAGALLGRNSA